MDVLQQYAAKKFKSLFEQYNIPLEFIGDPDFEYKNQINPQWELIWFILLEAGYTEEQAKWITHGIPDSYLKLDGEYASHPNNRAWIGYSSFGRIVHFAVSLFLKRHTQDKRFDVGFKNLRFRTKRMERTFGYKLIAQGVESPVERQIRLDYNERWSTAPRQPKLFDIWRDDTGNIATMQTGRMKGGNMGFIFINVDEAVKFLIWITKSRSTYAKDIALGVNTLGGWDSQDLTVWETEQEVLMGMYAPDDEENGG